MAIEGLMTVDLSVMLCTWNSSHRLAITLEALSRCGIPDGVTWELIVVNNNCTDDTDGTVARFMSTLPIVYVHEPRQGLSNARNAGLAAARGRLIIFTDDDVKPCTGWLTAYWTAFQEMPKGYYFGGPIESEFESGRPDEELLRSAMPSVKGIDWGLEPRQLIDGEGFVSANWACPIELVRAAGGFDIRLGLDPSQGYMRASEEADLMRRLRSEDMRPWYVPEARLSHFVPASKSTLRHIGDRVEAHGRYLALVGSAGRGRPRTIFGWPCRLTVQALERWIEWLWARLRGHKAYDEYKTWRRTMGMLKETRTLLRSGRMGDARSGHA